jgi:GTPase SAR1 family protein
MKSTLPTLNSPRSTRRLEQIAALRARGIGEHIDLPQLVVCGDQSAGKSSVLEGITGIPFPRQDGVCTKFPTEIILHHTDSDIEIKASILPSAARQGQKRIELQSYSRLMNDIAELPSVIADAGALMELRGFEEFTDGPAFSEDVLRIEVQGRTGMQLTIVDLPGLISVENEEQTELDVATVQKLVEKYISNPRTIILAVIQASNDIANQAIIKRARRVDRQGERTVGIITKPDLINEGTEKRIALLAKNQDTTKLKLGFFILKNPTPSELAKGITAVQREENERAFFESSAWKVHNLDKERVGVLALRNYLQILLDKHIEKELPKVRDEIRHLISTTESSLAGLGDERLSLGHMRLFLSRLAMNFHTLTVSALNGTYHETDSSFFRNRDGSESAMRLRAAIHRLNTTFSDYMKKNGTKRKIVDSSSSKKRALEDNATDIFNASSEDDEEEEGQILVTAAEMKKWVRKVRLFTIYTNNFSPSTGLLG